jgi:hypothetical protein
LFEVFLFFFSSFKIKSYYFAFTLRYQGNLWLIKLLRDFNYWPLAIFVYQLIPTRWNCYDDPKFWSLKFKFSTNFQCSTFSKNFNIQSFIKIFNIPNFCLNFCSYYLPTDSSLATSN